MPNTDNHAKIISAAQRLMALLAAPEPGLASWHLLCQDTFSELKRACLLGSIERQALPEEDRGERRAAEAEAARGGFFWLPCPRCGRPYGGQESGGGTHWIGSMSWSCCPRCPGDSHTLIVAGPSLWADQGPLPGNRGQVEPAEQLIVDLGRKQTPFGDVG